jgi:hypothetical protein
MAIGAAYGVLPDQVDFKPVPARLAFSDFRGGKYQQIYSDVTPSAPAMGVRARNNVKSAYTNT